MPLPNNTGQQKLPIPAVPKPVITPEMEKRCPGIMKSMNDWHKGIEDWRLKMAKILGLPIQ